MAFRFRHSIKIAPGVRMNIGKRSTSFSFGGRGSRTTLGFGGGSTGRRRSGSGRKSSGPTAQERKSMNIAQLEREAGMYNRAVNEGVNQHKKIPQIPDKHTWDQAAQLIEKPGKKFRIILFVVCWIFFLSGISVIADHIQEGKPVEVGIVVTSIFGFFALKPIYHLVRRFLLLREVAAIYDQAATGDIAAIEKLFGYILENLDWFRETTPSFEVAPDGRAIYVDIDLPEIEDMPNCVKIVRKTDQTINNKPKNEQTLCQEYATHVHSIVMRIAGTCFAVFPTIDKVLCSGYTQRANKSSGNIEDEYVVSAVFTREEWKKTNPAAADPVSFVKMFTHRQSLAADGRLNAIEPLTPAEA